ncbi:hypothetical protein KC333_g176 [Hortaea werneckii]|nr:hypothetical protein KC333_g176 [Hortaea werneckii]
MLRIVMAVADGVGKMSRSSRATYMMKNFRSGVAKKKPKVDKSAANAAGQHCSEGHQPVPLFKQVIERDKRVDVRLLVHFDLFHRTDEGRALARFLIDDLSVGDICGLVVRGLFAAMVAWVESIFFLCEWCHIRVDVAL